MLILLIVLLILALFYLFALHGRTGRMRLGSFRKFAFAHRGLHDENAPENSMSAFRAALAQGYGAELDVHLMADGNLAVIHDYSLLRTAGCDVQIEDLTAGELQNYRLSNGEAIPLLGDVLALIGGKVPLIIELKSTKENFPQLTDTAAAAMKGYLGCWCMESFDPRCIRHLKKHYPKITRGQLSENFFRSPESRLSFFLKLAMTLLLSNFLTGPDFVAFRFSDRDSLSLQICRKLWRLPVITWTLKTPEEFDAASEAEMIPIFEGFLP